MKILALDSTTRVATVAVCEDDRPLSLFTTDSGMTQSELLLPMARQALRAAHLSFADVELFALTVGPGSFTGVRIGAALVKGLAFEKNIPCVPISLMEALAENLLPLDGIYCPVADARRAQVYNALFESKENAPVRLCEDRLLPMHDLLDELEAKFPGKPVFACGDAALSLIALAEKEGRTVRFSPVPNGLLLPCAAAVARCGLRGYRAGKAVDDLTLAPVYLRPSQAERELAEKEKQSEK